MRNGCSIDSNGTKYWWKNWRLHRDDGPAVEWADGSVVWKQNGKYHREDGPAIECANGSKSWWIHDRKIE